MKIPVCIVLLCGFAAAAETFDEFYARRADRDINRARAAWAAATAPSVEPPAVAVPTAEEIAASIREERRQAVDAQWPILAAHPGTNDVPPGGMSYRLAEGGTVTWWVARQSDLLATQISAHGADGSEIVRTVNLRTGEDVQIDLRAIVAAKKFDDIGKAVKTNKAARLR